VGKRSRKRRDPSERSGAGTQARKSGAAVRKTDAASNGAPTGRKKKRPGPEPRPWPERPSVTRAKNAEAREALQEHRKKSRSELKNEQARAELEPLAPGERPRAVTVGAAVTALAATANLIAYLAGGTIQGERPAVAGVLGFTGLMYVMTWGLWRARYWAVLGLEALLGIVLLFFSLFALRIETWTDALICVVILVPAGALFWFLIRAMARIQMPRRPGTE
jgi:hypothetical protein